jgi:hypothetical protein
MPSTTSQLRQDIDSGRTGDKVNWPDPAAAPLGTDDEAGGTPTPGHAIDIARAAEAGRSLRSDTPPGRMSSVWLFIGFIGLVAVGLVVWAVIVL